MIDIRHNLGYRIRGLRIQKGIKQEKMALEIGLDRSYVSRVERDGANMTLKTLAKYAAFFEMPISEILADIESFDYYEYYYTKLPEFPFPND